MLFISALLVMGALMLLVAIICNVSADLHKKGYCISKGLTLSDDEKIHIAINDVIQEEQNEIDINTKDQGKQVYKVWSPYTDYKSFLLQNPDCCKFMLKHFVIKEEQAVTPSFSDWVYGYTADYITMNYRMHYVDGDGNIRETIRPKAIFLDDCGNRYTSMYFDNPFSRTDLGLKENYRLDLDPIIHPARR
jgi:hypothetical protein